MNRRDFLSGSLTAMGAGSLSLASSAQAKEGAEAQEYYELRQYYLHMGAKTRLVEEFWKNAALPALKRLGIGPVGVFNVAVGPDSPVLYVLIPHKTADSAMTLESRLAEDGEFLRTGAAYLNAGAADPAFLRMESSLLKSLSGMPRLAVPPGAAENKPRLFELRTYEAFSEKANLSKARMFNSGEIAAFRQAGFHPVLFSSGVIGKPLPSITYLLSFEDLAARDRYFAAFRDNPDFKRLAALPEYTDLLTNITNVILRPAAFSQI